MIYLGCQHCVKMIVTWYDDMVSSSECFKWLDLASLNQNQHSFYDIYVHGVHILLVLVSNVHYS